MMAIEERDKRSKWIVIALVGVALCFYFGFIIATGLSS
jgi:hypothetical protein